MTLKIYDQRDLMALDKAGNHYCRHVDHMTKESLHSKSDIAAELGWRDMQIAELQRKVEVLAAEVQAIRWASGQVYARGYNHGHLNTVGGLPYAEEKDLVIRGGETLCEYIDPDHCGVATDAIMAEIRAQGVGSFAKHCANKSKQAISSDTRDNWWLCGEHADDFAEKLRKEASND